MKVKDEFIQKVIDCGSWVTPKYKYVCRIFYDKLDMLPNVYVVIRIPIVKGSEVLKGTEFVGVYDSIGRKI